MTSSVNRDKWISRFKSHGLLLSVLALGLLVRLWGIKGSLPINMSDEEVYVVGALRVGRGDLNPHDFNNPSLIIYLDFIAFGFYFLVGHAAGLFNSLNDFKDSFYRDPTPFYLLARIITAAFGTASLFLLYKLVYWMRGKQTALIAALLLALFPFHVYMSHSAKCDTAMVFFVLLSLLFLVKYYDENRRRYFIAGCLFCGLAVSTKYTAAPLVLACVLSELLKPQRLNLRRLWRTALTSLALVSAGFLAATPYALLDVKTFYGDLVFLLSKSGTQWFGWEGRGIGLFEYPFRVFPAASGWTIYLFAIAGIFLYRWIMDRKEWLVFSYPIILFLLLSSTRHVSPNYALPLYPFMCILASIPIAGALGKMVHLYSRGLFLAIAVSIPLLAVVVSDHNAATRDTRLIAKDWIEEHIGTDRKIAAESYGPPLVPNDAMVRDILSHIHDPERGGQFRYYLEHARGKKYYVYVFPLFEAADRKPADHEDYASDEERRRYSKPNASSYDYSEVKRNFDYMILSGSVFSRFKAFPLLYPKQNEFYRQLDSNDFLLKEFTNHDKSTEKRTVLEKLLDERFGFVDHQGPVIKIYRFERSR